MLHQTSFYTEGELADLGLKSYGDNVLISRNAKFYTPSLINIGHNVRIDDFCILSGNVSLGSNIHISTYCALYGAKGIIMEDNTGLSPRVTVFSAMDDFGGDYLIGPVHEDRKINVTGGTVILEQYSQIGAGSIVFPNIRIAEGAVVGAMSLVNRSLNGWAIYAGVPIRKLKDRKKGLLTI